MNLLRLIERNLEQRKLATTLTALSVALGVMLVTAILLLHDELERTYRRPGKGYDMVVGPTGSPLQLVLNSVYHLDKSPGLISHHVWRELAGPEMKRYVRLAVPFSVGDNFKGFRVVATTDAVFSPRFPFPDSKTTQGKFVAGRPFHFDQEAMDEALAHLEGKTRVPAGTENESGTEGSHDGAHLGENEAVIGFEVARKLNLSVSDMIEPTHGVEGSKEHAAEHLWEVVGILKKSGTAADRVVFINMDSFYRIPEHSGSGGLLPNAAEKTAGISSVLLFSRKGHPRIFLLQTLNKRSDVQVADVSEEIIHLMNIVGNVDQVFMLVAILVVIIGVISIMVAIYNTMNERRRELAIMRALGARRATVFATIVGESTAIALVGGLVGLVLGHVLVALAAGPLESMANMQVQPLRFLADEFKVVCAVTLVGALAGLLPAMKAYRTNVAENLAPLS